ncbi:MAG: hypothetical protein ABSB97_05235 [Thermoplasmata archaeon]|jgi:hypothetical protein
MPASKRNTKEGTSTVRLKGERKGANVVGAGGIEQRLSEIIQSMEGKLTSYKVDSFEVDFGITAPFVAEAKITLKRQPPLLTDHPAGPT